MIAGRFAAVLRAIGAKNPPVTVVELQARLAGKGEAWAGSPGDRDGYLRVYALVSALKKSKILLPGRELRLAPVEDLAGIYASAIVALVQESFPRRIGLDAMADALVVTAGREAARAAAAAKAASLKKQPDRGRSS